MKKAIFLDRDGVINVDTGYVYKIDDFKFFPDVMSTLKYFQKQNYMLFIVTNQSGIARGYFTLEDIEILNEYILNEFKKENITISKIYFCPHLPEDNCACRKPNPKMLLDAQKEFNIDMKNSWMIGDKESDMKAGYNAEIENLVLVGKQHPKSLAKYNVKTLSDTIKFIF
jgi:D-glycero-D-manno-heptose 1,7-bisphosphate phosphatase